MYIIYTFVLYLLLPMVLIRMYWLGYKTPAYRQRWQERFGYLRPFKGIRPIWIHAVSVGEVQVSRPLVTFLCKHYPGVPIIITTVTPTGALTAAQVYADVDNVSHRYFPYDLPFAIRRFLALARPRALLVLETEIWPNLYRLCRQQSVPILLLNARLSAKSMQGYRLLGSLSSSTLQCTSVIAAQSREDAARFIQIGAPASRVQVSGNLKFDINLPRGVLEQGELIRQKLSPSRPIWIAASTHQGEEALVLEAHATVSRIIPGSLLILAPRHPERFDSVFELCVKQGYRTSRYTSAQDYTLATQIFLLDVLGQLPAHYAASDLAFVGGSLVPVGGHNMLEPASLGIPILTGPHVFNFTEVVRLLEEHGALGRVEDAAQMGQKVIGLLKDGNLRDEMGQRARQVMQQNQGSIDRIAELLERHIPAN